MRIQSRDVGFVQWDSGVESVWSVCAAAFAYESQPGKQKEAVDEWTSGRVDKWTH